MHQITKTLNSRSGKAAIAAACLLVASSAQAVSLYDGSLDTNPVAQGWNYGVIGVATESLGSGAVTLDTSLGNATSAGYSYSTPMDSSAGFTLAFTVQVHSESHTGNSNRAGFSVIALDSNHQGVELGFWTGNIWAQAVGFTKAETASYNTSAALTDYRLSLQGGSYALTVNGAASPLLTGVMRDYSAFGLPYSLNNFLFFGDDTSSAKARFSIASVSTVSTVPVPAAWVLMLGPMIAGVSKARWLRSKRD